MNYWRMDTPDGVSTLITHPMNRPDPLYHTFSGVVQTDVYPNNINTPFIWMAPGESGVMKRGRLAQVIPFHRDSLIADAHLHRLDAEDEREMKAKSSWLNGHRAGYMEEMWEPLGGTRNLPPQGGRNR